MTHPISAAIETLQFNAPQEESKTKSAFFNLIRSDLLRLMEKAPSGAKESLIESGATDLDEFMLAPEISHLALHATSDQAEAVSDFLYKAVLAEVAKSTGETGPFEALWSIRGDFFINQTQGEEAFVYHAPELFDGVTVDFNSPYCSFISNDELGATDESPIANYPMERMEEMMEILHQAVAPMQTSWPEIIRFIQKFTFHMIAKTLPNEGFSSGSNGLYIGRVVMCNLENTPLELIAEALVHEAAHGYLYMLETLQPWMPSQEHSRELGPSVPSCWTGNHISLRSFSQAVFVWYSLYNFWKAAQAKGLYRPEFVANRIQFIENGFEKLDMPHLQNLAKGTIPKPTMAVFQQLKSSILSPSTIQP